MIVIRSTPWTARVPSAASAFAIALESQIWSARVSVETRGFEWAEQPGAATLIEDVRGASWRGDRARVRESVGIQL